jgi:hypothetical protein
MAADLKPILPPDVAGASIDATHTKYIAAHRAIVTLSQQGAQ